jgi:hypothetical protein
MTIRIMLGCKIKEKVLKDVCRDETAGQQENVVSTWDYGE